MTDTLRDQLTRELRRKVIFITPQEQEVFLAYEKLADAAIAFITAWALEPAQVERAARAGWEREQMIGRPKWEVLFAVMREQLTEDTRAAIAALFGEPK